MSVLIGAVKLVAIGFCMLYNENMKIKRFIILFVILLWTSASAYAVTTNYHIVKKLPLGGEGGWDALTVDSLAERLYLSRGTHVMVIDLATDKLVGDIPDTPGVHGIALAPELNRGFISNGKSNTATIFDLKTLKVLGQVKTGGNPDAILYDSSSKQVFIFNGRSNDATVLNAASSLITGTIPLGGKPEFAVSDNSGKVLVNLEDTNEVVEIDCTKLTVTKRFSLKPCEEPTGIAFDQEHKRIFSACHNKMMAILDAGTGQMISTVPIGENVDGCDFDQGTGLAFSSNGEGTLTVVQETSPGKFEAIETVSTQKGARTMALDYKTHYIYLPTALFSKTETQTLPNGKVRPVMIKDSFLILVIGK
jgi:DNA-binding beta-propeller fold protein YncE